MQLLQNKRGSIIFYEVLFVNLVLWNKHTYARTVHAPAGARVTVIVCPHIITVPVCPRPLTGCRCRRTTCWWSSACTRQCSGQNRLSLSGWRLRTAHTLSLNKARRDTYTPSSLTYVPYTLYYNLDTDSKQSYAVCETALVS